MAVAATIWWGVHFETWNHLLLGVVIAPFTLMRTDAACVLTWKLAALAWRWSEKLAPLYAAFNSKRGNIIGGILLAFTAGSIYVVASGTPPVLVKIAVWFLVILFFIGIPVAVVMWFDMLKAPWLIVPRLVAQIVSACANPIASVNAIPGNWFRVVFCEDSMLSPELLPTLTDPAWSKPVTPFTNLSDAWSALHFPMGDLVPRKFKSRFMRSTQRMIATLLLLPMFILPSIAFRFSAKATSLVWLPLIWALRPHKPATEDWHTYLRLEARSDIYKIRAIYSFGVIGLILSKVVLLMIAQHELALRASSWHLLWGDRLGVLAAAFVRPGEIPLWQVASCTNAIIAIGCFGWIRRWRSRLDEHAPVDLRTVERSLGVAYAVSRLLTIYTLVCMCYTVYTVASELPLPQIGTKLFPWL